MDAEWPPVDRGCRPGTLFGCVHTISAANTAGSASLPGGAGGGSAAGVGGCATVDHQQFQLRRVRRLIRVQLEHRPSDSVGVSSRISLSGPRDSGAGVVMHSLQSGGQPRLSAGPATAVHWRSPAQFSVWWIGRNWAALGPQENSTPAAFIRVQHKFVCVKFFRFPQ